MRFIHSGGAATNLVRFKDIQSAKKWVKNVTTYTLVDDLDLKCQSQMAEEKF